MPPTPRQAEFSTTVNRRFWNISALISRSRTIWGITTSPTAIGFGLLRVDPMLKNLHSDARWLPFLRQSGLADEQVK